MSSSIATEVEKLHALVQAGVLTDEEFREAKRQLIFGGGGGVAAPSAPTNAAVMPPPTPLASSEQVLPPSVSKDDDNPYMRIIANSEGRAANPSADGIDCALFEPSHVHQHDGAYRHLLTILGNIITHPQDLRFRRLRLDNPRLSAELFSDPGAMPFLTSCGFEVSQAAPPPSATTGQPYPPRSGGSGGGAAPPPLEDVMLLPLPSASLQLSEQVRKLQAGQQCLQQLQQRDADAAVAAGEAHRAMRTMLLDIRRSRCRERMLGGGGNSNTNKSNINASVVNTPLTPLEAHILGEFLTDSCGDDLLSAQGNATTLETVLRNALKELPLPLVFTGANTNSGNVSVLAAPPAAIPRVHRLPLSNANAARLLVGQPGALELLVEHAGWVLLGAAPSQPSKPLVLWAPSSLLSAPAALAAPSAPQACAEVADISGVVPTDLRFGSREGAATESTSTSAAQGRGLAALQATLHFLTTVIIPAIRAQQQAFAEQQRQAALEAARAEVQKIRAAEAAVKRRQAEAEALRQRTLSGGGTRVPLAEAVKYLLGRQDESDEDNPSV